MMQATMSRDSTPAAPEHRNRVSTPLNLIEIERASVVDAMLLDDSMEADRVFAMGEMRELCPQCKSVHLKLVLRQKRVRQSHLFCDACDKCFDARYLDGSPALDIEY